MKVTLRPGLWLLMFIVFIITFGSSTVMWSFLRGQETRRAQTLLASASGSLQDRVQAELDLELGALQRMAAKWQIRPNMQREEWEYDARQLLESHLTLLSVSWLENPQQNSGQLSPAAVASGLRVLWSLPSIYEAPVIRLHSLVKENRPEMLQSVIEEHRTRISEPIHVANRGKAFVVYVPSIVDGELKGVVVGLFHLHLLMDVIFDRLLASDYSLLLMDGYEEIYRRGEPKNRPGDWEYQGLLKVFSNSYKLRLWPNPDAQRANEKLADLILLSGFGVALLLTALVYFASRRPSSKTRSTVVEPIENRRRSEERLQLWESVLANIDEAVILVANEHVLGAGPVILYVNEAFTRLCDMPSGEVVGKSARAIFGGAFPARETEVEAQIVLHNKSDQPLELTMRARPLRNSQKKLTHWIVSLHPTGVVSPAPAGMSASLLEHLVANAPLPVQVFDLTGTVLHWNSLAEAVTGFSADEIVGKATPLGVQFPTPLRWTRQDLRIVHKNGERLDLAVWTAPLANVEGVPPGRFMSFMADLTSEHLENEAIAAREASFRALVENASDILALLDAESNLQYVNPAVKETLGLDPAALEGAPSHALVQQVTEPNGLLRLKLRQADGPPLAMDYKLEPIPGTTQMLFAAHPTAVPAEANTVLLDSIADAIITFDTEHCVSWMNRAAEKFYGLTAAQAHGKSLNELLPDWLQAPGRDHVFAELDRQGFWKGEISNFTPAGRELVQDVSIAVTYDSENRPTGSVAVHRDVTPRKSAIDALVLENQDRTLNALNSTDGFWDWNVATNEVYFSPRWKSMLGYADEEIAGDLEEWFLLVHPDDIAILRNRITTYLKGQPEHLEAEYRARTRGGSYRWMMTRAAAMRNSEGRITRLVGLQTDIHDQKQLDEQLLFEAFHDSLTGLDNRALFLDRLNGALAHPSGPFAVLFLDLKEFHKVNESLGMRGGDKALAEASRRIAACLPPGSFLARHGSDEFVAMIPAADPSLLAQLISLLDSRLALPYSAAGKEVSFCCSAGYALSTDRDFPDGESMLQAASAAMVSGRNLKDPPAAEPVVEFQSNQFRVFYQPIVALDSGEIRGMEALIRWQHPERGLLLPAEFLPEAEQSGLILTIDRWMLREACSKLAEMNRRFGRLDPLVLTVNLSHRHFADPQSAALLEQVIHESGIDPACLRIEINPVEGMEVDSLISRFIDVDIAGAVEAGSVKLPPALVRGLTSGRNLEKARAIIGDAQRQNLKVVAEGVESLEQLVLLREIKCHFAQGFYFTRPASEKDTERLLARAPRW